MTQPSPEQDLRFPIGKFDLADFSSRTENIDTIASLPYDLANAVGSLTEEQLDTRYRPEGWTLRQTVHHVADSHANSLIRFKLALTEDSPPTIKPYREERWAELEDSKLPVEISLQMISAIHTRWTTLLQSMNDADFAREFIHPETGSWTLEKALALYAWHSRHHLAHITTTSQRNGW